MEAPNFISFIYPLTLSVSLSELMWNPGHVANGCLPQQKTDVMGDDVKTRPVVEGVTPKRVIVNNDVKTPLNIRNTQPVGKRVFACEGSILARPSRPGR